MMTFTRNDGRPVVDPPMLETKTGPAEVPPQVEVALDYATGYMQNRCSQYDFEVLSLCHKVLAAYLATYPLLKKDQ